MQFKLFYYSNFLFFKRSNSIALSLWEKAFQKQYDQESSEWTVQLIEYQLKTTGTLNAGNFNKSFSRP